MASAMLSYLWMKMGYEVAAVIPVVSMLTEVSGDVMAGDVSMSYVSRA